MLLSLIALLNADVLSSVPLLSTTSLSGEAAPSSTRMPSISATLARNTLTALQIRRARRTLAPRPPLRSRRIHLC